MRIQYVLYIHIIVNIQRIAGECGGQNPNRHGKQIRSEPVTKVYLVSFYVGTLPHYSRFDNRMCAEFGSESALSRAMRHMEYDTQILS